MKFDRKIFQPIRLSLLDRYLVSELILPFIFCVGIFSSAGVAIGTLSDLANKIFEFNLPTIIAFQAMLFKLPEYVSYAIPIAVLLTTLITYGRFSNESEIIAFRSCGISIYRLILPTIILSFFISLINFSFNEFIVPAAKYQGTLVQEPYIPEEVASFQKSNVFYPEFNKIIENGIAKEGKIKNLFYAESFDGKVMKNITVLQWAKQGLKSVIISEKAFWDERHQLWHFIKGAKYKIASDGAIIGSETFTEEELTLSNAPIEFALKTRDPYEMNLVQSLEYIKILQKSGDRQNFLVYQIRTQQKVAFPFVCIVFALVGAVVGSTSSNFGRAKSFSYSIIIVFGYYLSTFLLGALAIIEVLSPEMAAWIPNIVGIIIGGYLLASNGD